MYLICHGCLYYSFILGCELDAEDGVYKDGGVWRCPFFVSI